MKLDDKLVTGMQMQAARLTSGVLDVIGVYHFMSGTVNGPLGKRGPDVARYAHQELSADKRKLLQDMADEFHTRFRNVVVKARPAVDGNLETTFDGRNRHDPYTS